MLNLKNRMNQKKYIDKHFAKTLLFQDFREELINDSAQKRIIMEQIVSGRSSGPEPKNFNENNQ